MMKTISVPADFKRLVFNLESHHHEFGPKIKFKTLREMECCAAYFTERAIARQEFAAKFAQKAHKLFFLTPANNSEVNFRKTVIAECNSQVTQIYESLNAASNVTIEKALGVFKFFGELFNIGFIYNAILKKHVDILAHHMNECYISNRCFYLLLFTVQDKVWKVSEEDYSTVVRSLVEIIENSLDRSPPPIPPTKPKPVSKTKATQQVFNKQFPSPNAFSLLQRVSPEPSNAVSPEEKLMSFIQLLEQLSPINAQEIVQNIEQNYQLCSDDGTWQLYYECLIEKALTNHDLAGPIVEICQKLSRSNSESRQGVKIEEYKKYVHGLINTKLDDLFNIKDESLTKTQAFSILKLIEKLLDYSLCSIGSIASYIDVLIRGSQLYGSIALPILSQLMLLVKNKIKSAKIRKLPEDVRREIFTIITVRKQPSEKFKIFVKEIAEYLNIQNPKEVESMNDISTNDEATSSKKTLSNPSPSEHHERSFDYLKFIEEFAAPVTVDKSRSLVFSAIAHPAFNFNLLAQGLFEKSFRDEDYEKNVGIAVIIDSVVTNESSQSFKDVFINTSFEYIGAELLKDQSGYIAPSVVGILVELHLIEWVHIFSLLLIMDKRMVNNFAPVARVKLFLAFSKPLEAKNFTEWRKDFCAMFLDLAQYRAAESQNPKCYNLYIELIDLLYNISMKKKQTVDQPAKLSSTVKETPKNSFLDTKKIHNILMTKSVEEVVKEIESFKIRTIEGVTSLVEVLINHSLNNLNEVSKCAEVASKLDLMPVTIHDGPEISFKNLLITCCKLQLDDFFLQRIFTSKVVSSNYSLVQFIGELFKLDMMPRELIRECMTVLMSYESTCLYAVRCIDIMMKVIGPKLDEYNDPYLGDYYRFFNSVVKSSDKTVRSKVYEGLIELRRKNWIIPTVESPKQVEPVDKKVELNGESCPSVNINQNDESKATSIAVAQKPIAKEEIVAAEIVPDEEQHEVEHEQIEAVDNVTSLIIDIESFEDERELESFTSNLKQHLTSSLRFKSFIGALLSRPSLDYRHASTIVKLFKGLLDLSTPNESGEEITFKECLIQALNSEFIKSSSKRMLDEVTKNFLSFLIIFVGELYRQEIFADDDLSTWLLHKHIKLVPLEHLTYLSSIIAPKVQLQGDKHVKMILGMLETSIHDSTMEMYFSIKDDIALVTASLMNR